jgi:hypothetical protein
MKEVNCSYVKNYTWTYCLTGMETCHYNKTLRYIDKWYRGGLKNEKNI